MIKNNMNENPPIVQRITSASQVDADKRNSIYELITHKNKRRYFVRRDGSEFDKFIKPNCEKRLFYYINTGVVELSYHFADVYYNSERLNADVAFRVRLCPAVDLELNPEFADWIKGQNCEVLYIENLAKSLNERLKQYFSAILNGATTLALIDRYGAGAVSDDKTYWTDAGLPSWLEIVETSSIQALGEASQELIKENDRIARARERQRKLLEQIDIVVTEDKLANVKDEIAHRNKILREQRELEIARINRLKSEEVLKLELSEIDRDFKEACHDVDYMIKCSDLELKKVQVQEKLRKIENESRESEARVKRLEQEIKESQARIGAIIRSKIWMFLITCFVFGLMVALGVVSYLFVEHYSEKQKERDAFNVEHIKTNHKIDEQESNVLLSQKSAAASRVVVEPSYKAANIKITEAFQNIVDQRPGLGGGYKKIGGYRGVVEVTSKNSKCNDVDVGCKSFDQGVNLECKDNSVKRVQLWKDGPYWADRNIGASKPEDYGYYFRWGDTVGYKHKSRSKWVSSDGSILDGRRDNCASELEKNGRVNTEGVLLLEYDAAHVAWGGKWRMPTQQEIEDLLSKCDWHWAKLGRVGGVVVQGRGDFSSSSIFLPATGCSRGGSLYNVGSEGGYWSSVYDFNFNGVKRLCFIARHEKKYTTTSFNNYMMPIRPVQGVNK